MKRALDGSRQSGPAGMAYKWTALSNTTLGVLIATMNATSILIAMPVIFRGININPLDPSNFSFLLWLLMGYTLVSAILVVTAGRLGDMFGRVRVYNFGFAIFTASAIALSVVWSQGPAGALELIGLRMVQAVGGAMMMASSAAILTDAFPSEQLGFAMGINMIAALAGSFLGILAGGVLSEFSWRWVFIVNVPVGLVGTTWGFWKLREIGIRTRARIDWVGNLAFAAGLTALLVGITYGIVPYGNSSMGWGNPFVLGMSGAGIVILVAFVLLETRIKDPMFNLRLFKIRAFTAGNLAGLLGSIGRGGMQFMLIIWLQGIWLPLHGYAFTQTPLWAGIYMLPLTVGFLVSGPISGLLSDRFGARPVRHRGNGHFSDLLRAAHVAADGLLVPRLCQHHRPDRSGDGNVRGAQYGGDHDQRARPGARRRLGDARDFHEHRHAAIDRDLLQPDDPGAQLHCALGHVRRPYGKRRAGADRAPALPAAADRLSLRLVPGL